ncbi:MAG: hypothetical protein SGI87_00425 [Flavobacteriales bacterium]|nr:hypothetical protein [Flavobacteriales bacterium]
MDYLLCRIVIIPNHAMEISEFIGRTFTLLHRVDSRIPQRINLKTLPMRDYLMVYIHTSRIKIDKALDIKGG